MKKNKLLFESTSVLVGTIIGAGVLGIPYAIYQAGFLTGIILMVVLFGVVLLLNLYLGEIVLSTKKQYQLTGYANKYLGKWGKYLMFGSTVFGFYGALLAYMIGEGRVLAALTGGSEFVYSLIFFAFASLLVYVGLTVIKKTEFILTAVILLIVLFISVWGAKFIYWENLGALDFSKLFLPFGVIFFSIGGASAVPQVREVLKNNENLVKKSIIWGTTIPFVVYFIFALVVIGVSGFNVTEVATIGLGKTLGKSMIIFGNLFAFFTMATSFLTLGLALKNTYEFDFKIKPFLAWLMTISLPLVVFIFGLNDFVKVMGTVGALGGGIEGILIGLMYLKLKNGTERKPEYQLTKSAFMVFLLSIIFAGGIIYTLWTL